MATNRIDILDSALLRPGRIDRKIEFPPPNEEVRQQILNIIMFFILFVVTFEHVKIFPVFFFCFFFLKKSTLRQGLYFYVYIQNMFLKMYLHVEFTSQFLLNWLCFSQARLDILKIHSRKMNLTRGINLRKIAELMPGSSGAEVKVLYITLMIKKLIFFLAKIFGYKPNPRSCRDVTSSQFNFVKKLNSL